MHRDTFTGPPKIANSSALLNKSMSDNSSSVYGNSGSGMSQHNHPLINQREKSFSKGVDSSNSHPNPSAKSRRRQKSANRLNKSSDFSRHENYANGNNGQQQSHGTYGAARGSVDMNKSSGGITLQGNNDYVFPEAPPAVAPKPMNPAARYLASRRDKNTGQGAGDPKQVVEVLDSAKLNGQHQTGQNGINLNKSFGGFDRQQGDDSKGGDQRSNCSKNLNKSFGGFDANGGKINTRYQQRLNRKLKKQQQKASNPDIAQEVTQKEVPAPESSTNSIALSTVGVSSEDVPKTANPYFPSNGKIGGSQENGNLLNKSSEASHLRDDTEDNTQQKIHDSGAALKGPIDMKKSFGGMTLQGNNGSVFTEVPSTVASKAMNPAARYLASRRDKTTVTSDLTHSNKALGGVASQKDNGFKQVGNVLDSTKMNGQHPTDQSGEGQDQKNSVNLNKSFGGFDRQQGEGAKDGDQRSSKNLNKSFGGFDANKVNTRYQQRLNRKLKKQQQRASNPDIPQEVTQKVPEASITVKTPSTVGVSSMDVPKTAVHSDPSANIENSQENSSLLNKSSDSSHLGNYTVDTTHQKSHDSSTKGPMNKSLGGMTLQGNNGSVFTEKPSTVPPKSMNPAARYLASRRDENTAQGTNNSKDLNKSLCGTKSNSQRQACQDGKGQGPKTPINLNKTFGGFNDQNVNSNISKDRGSKNSKNLNKSFGGYAANGENVSSKQQQQEVIQKEAPVPETSITSMAALTDNGSIEDVSKTVAEDVSINLNWTLPAGNLHEAFKEEEDIYSNQTINCSIASSQFVRTQPSAVKVFAYYEKQRENNGEKMNRKVWDLIDGGDEMAILLDKLKTKNRELTETEIKQLVLADPTSLRLCILYEVVGKKSIIESFLNITKIIGTQDIDCNDFEFWFKRFESGNWDLNQKTLFDMPIEILTNIVEELDFLTQMQLRKVSHGLRHIVDDVRFSIDEIICDFEKYGKSKGLAIMVYGPNEDPEKEFNTFKYHEDDSERALNDLRILLENRHLRLDRLEWRDDGSPAIKKQLINMLSSLNHKLEINCLEINANGDVMIGLMKAIKPATLEEISCESELLLFHIDRIAQLEQWKKAKYVYFPTVIFELAFSYHHFMHFKYVDVHVVSISIGDIFFIKQLFSQNNVLDRFICYSKNRPSISDIEDSLGPSEISLDEDHESFSDFEQGVYRIYSIPGSEDVLQLSLTNDDVIFVKGSKESV